nr:hypothetical protein [uncultured Cetobacterium sp.]
MKNKIAALGQYIVKQTGKSFNFKMIKTNPIYKEVLFTVGQDDYLVSDDKRELLGVVEEISMRTPNDYPVKLAKRYTHAKFKNISKKKEEVFTLDNKKYYIIKL